MTSISPEGIINEFKNKPIDKGWSFAEFKPSDTSKWTHGYHRYPAKFIPQLVEKLCDEYITTEQVHINDPFLGCGTTAVTAISRGYKVSGTDINKIAYLIAKVKSTPIDPIYLDDKVKKFLATIEWADTSDAGLFHTDIKPLIPERHIERIDYWFPEEQKLALGKILRIISQEEDAVVRDFLLVAFSHVLKNCSIWLQGSTKPTRDFKKTPTPPYQALKRHLAKMIRGNNDFFGVAPSTARQYPKEHLNIQNADARHQPTLDNSVDLIITSSPYVTSYEYADLHQLSTIWLDLAESLTEYRKEFIGTAYKGYEDRALHSKIAQGIVDEMLSRSEKMATEIEAFFIDMQQVFDESFRILKQGGRCCYVIGNTSLKKVDILNAEVFAESLQYSGFKFDRVIKREIPSKILPQKRDEKTGRFASNDKADTQAYPVEYIVIGLKE